MKRQRLGLYKSFVKKHETAVEEIKNTEECIMDEIAEEEIHVEPGPEQKVETVEEKHVEKHMEKHDNSDSKEKAVEEQPVREAKQRTFPIYKTVVKEFDRTVNEIDSEEENPETAEDLIRAIEEAEKIRAKEKLATEEKRSDVAIASVTMPFGAEKASDEEKKNENGEIIMVEGEGGPIMKHKEGYVCSRDEVLMYLRELANRLDDDSLVIATEKVDVPSDRELEYKTKYENDEYEGQFSIKISWVNAEREEEEEEQSEV